MFACTLDNQESNADLDEISQTTSSISGDFYSHLIDFNSLSADLYEISAVAYGVSREFYQHVTQFTTLSTDLYEISAVAYGVSREFYQHITQFTTLSTDLYEISAVAYGVSRELYSLIQGESNYHTISLESLTVHGTTTLHGGLQDQHGNNLLNQSGSGTGSGIDVSYFEYYFINKPWPPVYISNGSYNPPTETTDGSYQLGNFDASSGRYDNTSKSIQLRWKLPPQTRAGFNFASPPRNLSRDGITLDVGPYNIFNNNMYNKLPYRESLHIDVRYTEIANPNAENFDTIEWSSFIPGSTLPLDQTSGTAQPLGLLDNRNIFPTVVGANFKSGTGDVSSTYDASLIYTNVGTTSSIIKSGVDRKFQFRISLKNSNTEGETNYLYIPDPNADTPYLDFASFGQARRPDLIIIALATYNTLSIDGSGGETGNSSAEDGLDTPFNDLTAAGLSVEYNFTLTINPDGFPPTTEPYTLQFYKPTYKPSNVTIDYVSNKLETSSWNIDSNWPLNTPDSYENASNSLNTIIYPGYTYKISNYFMNLYKPNLSVSRSDDALVSAFQTDSVTVPPPSRSEVTNNGGYYNFFNSELVKDFNSIDSFTADNVKINNGTLLSGKSNIETGDNIYFFTTTSTPATLSSSSSQSTHLKLRNSEADDTEIGTKLVDKYLSKFKIETSTDSNQSIELESSFSKGYKNDSFDQDNLTSGFHLIQSASIDAVDGYTPSPSTEDLDRLRGWYLGFNIYFKATIDLEKYPDIANRTQPYTPYTPYTITFSQIVKNSTGEEAVGTKEFKLLIAEKPSLNINFNNLASSSSNPSITPNLSSNGKFFGLPLPEDTNGSIISFQLQDLQFTNIDINWRPTDDANLVSLKLLYKQPSGNDNGWGFNWLHPKDNLACLANQLSLYSTLFKHTFFTIKYKSPLIQSSIF